MSNSFFVYIPSNIKDYPNNSPNNFRLRLPKPLEFKGDWVCGLHSINFPYSWPSTIGTLDKQAIFIHYKDDGNGKEYTIKIPIPPASHTNVEQLENFLQKTLISQSNALESIGKNFIESPSVTTKNTNRKRRHAETIEKNKQISEELLNYIITFFHEHPDDYWDVINDKKNESEELENELKQKAEEYKRISTENIDEKHRVWLLMQNMMTNLRDMKNKIENWKKRQEKEMIQQKRIIKQSSNSF